MELKTRQTTDYIDLGITTLNSKQSLARKQEFVSIIRRSLASIGDSNGQIILANRITDRQKRHAVVFLNKNGLRSRVQIDRGFPFHNGEELVFGTRIGILERKLGI